MLFDYEPEATDRMRVGGKASNLARLLHRGFSIPRFMVVTTDAYNRFYRKYLRDECHGYQSSEAREAFFHAPFMREFIQEFEATWPLFAPSDDDLFAVRSSATMEDGSRHSFAGLFESRLAIGSADKVLEAVRTCWASSFSPRLEAYRRLHNITSTCQMAVIVQHMVAAESSGVAFTAHPISGSLNEAVIESTFGLPNLLVEGRITPDRFIVELETGKILSHSLGSKKLTCYLDANAEIHTFDTPNKQSNRYSLTDQEIISLTELVREVASAEGSPQDVEWGIVHGQLYIFQTRPITTLKTHYRE